MFRRPPIELPIDREDVRIIMWLQGDIRTELVAIHVLLEGDDYGEEADPNPEEQAAFDERTRLIWEHIAKLDRKIADERAARERHRRRLQRLSFGLLGRG